MDPVTPTSSRFTISPTSTSDEIDYTMFELASSPILQLNNPMYFPGTSETSIDQEDVASIDDDEDSDEEEVTNLEAPRPPGGSLLRAHEADLFNVQLDEGIELSTVGKESQEEDGDGDGRKRYESWDKAISSAETEHDYADQSDWPIQLLKVLAYNVTFVLILLCAVTSKCLTLLMTSMIYPNRPIEICNTNGSNQTGIDPPLAWDKTYSVLYEPKSVHRIAWLWCLYGAIITPYIFAFWRAVRIVTLRKVEVPKTATLVTVFIFETLHIIGLSMLVFLVLPNFDVVRGAIMLSSVCTVPSLLRLCVTSKPASQSDSTQPKNSWKLALSTSNPWLAWLIFALQLLSLAAWTVIDHYESISGIFHIVPICLFLVSFEWWENYLVPGRMVRYLSFLDNARKDLEKSRYFLGLFLNPWKGFLLFCLMILHQYMSYGGEVATMMFTNFTDGFKTDSQIKVFDNEYLQSGQNGSSPEFAPFTIAYHLLSGTNPLTPVFLMILHIVVNYLCYWLAKIVCKICIQKISFAIPISLTIPMTVALLWEFTKLSQDDKCFLVGRFSFFQHIFWYGHLDSTFLFTSYINGDWLYIPLSMVWYLGTQFALTTHIWKRHAAAKMATSDQLFVNPKYNSMLIDQSLTLNRRCLKVVYTGEEENTVDEEDDNYSAFDGGSNLEGAPDLSRRTTQAQIELEEMRDRQFADWAREWEEIAAEHGLEVDAIDPKANPEMDQIQRIYACATMWHESENEMLLMLKSIMRLDFDQGAKRIARSRYGEVDEYYELEVNIFFDNAFDQGPNRLDPSDRRINSFVEQLIEVMNQAATQVLGTAKVLIEYPTIVATPFGGKLIWKLPGGNRLIAHLKDKTLIRDRKRWSQVQYMYYLLGHRLAARADLSARRKATIANNTFILALDGDINFQPSAVHMVVDLMKKNAKLGAACGRIHPIGSGLVVWYQKFEYAVGHWFQKAAEHIFGCVLCSPGCFSLFRARALMDVSVMHRYTTRSTEALHYVQYDQGEDRWLCTLLLQRGWRIEYCAASDSYTHAPEGFGEFYTQRRRWAPSTMANIIDLLSHYRSTVAVNENVSRLYIIYQAFLMFGSILSPATITLMVVTAMNTAMSISLTFSIYSNLVVILLYTFACYYLDDRHNGLKINFAMILSTVYALLMLAVLVGTAIEMVKQGIFSPNSLFFTAMVGSFFLAATIHPHEFACVFFFPIYMLLIPSMYLLLTIYSVTNMHIVSWGTREIKESPGPDDKTLQTGEPSAEPKLSKTRQLLAYIDPRKYGKSSSGMLSCACCSTGSASSSGLLSCFCCSTGGNSGNSPTSPSNVPQLEDLKATVTDLKTVVTQIQSQLPHLTPRLTSFSEIEANVTTRKTKNVDFTFPRPSIVSRTETMISSVEESPFYDDPSVPRWITSHPKLRNFKRKTLHPRERQFWLGLIEKYLYPIKPNVAEQAKIESELLDLRNKALFAYGFLNILVVLLFFILQSHEDLQMKIPIGSQTILMHPVGFWLVLFFGALLLVQCAGMIIHRFGTLTQLLAYTEIDLFKRRKETMVRLVKRVIFMRLNARNREMETANQSNADSPASTIHGGGGEFDVERQRRQSRAIQLDAMFKKQIKALKRDNSQFTDPRRRLIDESAFSRLSSKRTIDPSGRVISLPLARRRVISESQLMNQNADGNLEVVVEQGGAGQGQTEQQQQQPVMATTSLRIWSNVDRFTGSLRNLKRRAGLLLRRSFERPLADETG